MNESSEFYRHSKGLHPRSHFSADSAKSDDRQSFAIEFSAYEVLFVAPLTGPDTSSAARHVSAKVPTKLKSALL